jgi:hypothetical protein
MLLGLIRSYNFLWPVGSNIKTASFLKISVLSSSFFMTTMLLNASPICLIPFRKGYNMFKFCRILGVGLIVIKTQFVFLSIFIIIFFIVFFRGKSFFLIWSFFMRLIESSWLIESFFLAA